MKIIYDKDALHKPGVYGFTIENKNGKGEYIGQTSRSNAVRWREHISSFKKLTCNRKIKKFITSDSVITFYQIKECHTKKSALKWEKHYIKEMHPSLNVKMK